MRRNIKMFFFCLALTGAAVCAEAELTPAFGTGASVAHTDLGAFYTVEPSGCAGNDSAANVSQDPADLVFTLDGVSGVSCAGPVEEMDVAAFNEEIDTFLSEPALSPAVCTDEQGVRSDGSLFELFCRDMDVAGAPPGQPQFDGVEALPDVPLVVNKSVESFMTYFQTRGRKYFEKWLTRSSRYMSMITEILREDGLPEDLFYIAVIESGLNPYARSKSDAVGMWQFIAGTARNHGLRVDWWIDERRDPEKATRAAAKYLKNLYNEFGSWYLAAAGYNAGEGRVRRAVRKHGSDDFWELARHKRTWKRETKNYVPKYLAAMLIAKDPASYGFSNIDYHEAVTYDKVNVPQATDLRVIARAAGTTVTELRRLNPELLRWFTPPDYPGYEIKLPAGTRAMYTENMAKIPPQHRLRFHRHKVRPGDTLIKIARKYKTQVKPIIYLNEIKNPRFIRAGTLLVVPVRARGKKVADAGAFGLDG